MKKPARGNRRAAPVVQKSQKTSKNLPVPSDVHPALASAWEINPKMMNKKHFLFDAVPPYVEYKRGEKFEMSKDFPERGDDTPSELTDTQMDGDGEEQMSYNPRDYTYVLSIQLTLALALTIIKGRSRPSDVLSPERHI